MQQILEGRLQPTSQNLYEKKSSCVSLVPYSELWNLQRGTINFPRTSSKSTAIVVGMSQPFNEHPSKDVLFASGDPQNIRNRFRLDRIFPSILTNVSRASTCHAVVLFSKRRVDLSPSMKKHTQRRQ